MHLLGALDCISVALSIRVQVTDSSVNGEHLTRSISSSFLRLPNLNIENFLPGSSSTIVITSKVRSCFDDELIFPFLS